MSRRRYDHRRVDKNEMRRLRLAKSLPRVVGPAHLSELQEWLGISAHDPQHIVAAEIVDARNDRAVERLCRFGRCSEVFDPKRKTVISSLGPAGGARTAGQREQERGILN